MAVQICPIKGLYQILANRNTDKWGPLPSQYAVRGRLDGKKTKTQNSWMVENGNPIVVFCTSLLSFLNVPMWCLIMRTIDQGHTDKKGSALGSATLFGLLLSIMGGVAAVMCFFRYVRF